VRREPPVAAHLLHHSNIEDEIMKRTAILLYGIISYAVFLGTFLYAIGFIGNIAVPKSIDTGTEGPWLTALAVNALLLTVFALQHSIMARPAFKRWITRLIPESAERTTYVMASSVAFLALFWAWRPMSSTIFAIESELLANLVMGISFAGVGLVLYSTFLIDHFDLFGLRQVWLQFRRRPYVENAFVTPSLYRHIRHPLYLGWFIVFWATPTMTVGHLLMALGTTAYILVAIVFEERDLCNALSSDYAAYRERTPKFIPSPSLQRSRSRVTSGAV
jgi:protein-S-isoprenylcysteine O-methyltransferase Ste14